MYSNEIAIEVNNLSKCYEIYSSPISRLKQFILPNFQKLVKKTRKQYFEEFLALQNISFEIKKGETVGIIGRNGSGKSTLLQIICGTLTPTSGNITTNGRIAALLELGSGFNPEFTGRDNVYLNAAVLGLSKNEIDNKFDDIAAFADIKQFLDQPVKTYSSGMVARLAFSVAVQVNPDILVIDEALSVGDMAFQEKSFTRMKRIRDDGTSILFVSHSPSAVRNFCNKAIWLDAGQMKSIGERLIVCDQYQNDMDDRIQSDSVASQFKNFQSLPEKLDQTIKIVSITSDKTNYQMGEDIEILIKLKFQDKPPTYGVGLIFYDSKNNVVSIINSLRDDIFFIDQKETLKVILNKNNFSPGVYNVTISISDENGMFSYDKIDLCINFIIEMKRSSKGLAKVDGVFRCEHEWITDNQWALKNHEDIWISDNLFISKNNKVPLVALLRVRDEELILQDTLDHLASFSDAICVYDDASSDMTRHILMNHKKVFMIIKNDVWETSIEKRLVAETRHRGLLLQEARNRLDFLWCMCCDADERYIGRIREYVTESIYEKPDGIRIQLFDAYMTENDSQAYEKNKLLLNFRSFFGPERRDILMLWKNNERVKFSGLDSREPIIKGSIGTNFLCQHYGKSLSNEHWESTCSYYVENFPWDTYGKKWELRKGKSIHDVSDFNRQLYKWCSELFENSIKIY